jgi:hypothetical protein
VKDPRIWAGRGAGICIPSKIIKLIHLLLSVVFDGLKCALFMHTEQIFFQTYARFCLLLLGSEKICETLSVDSDGFFDFPRTFSLSRVFDCGVMNAEQFCSSAATDYQSENYPVRTCATLNSLFRERLQTNVWPVTTLERVPNFRDA